MTAEELSALPEAEARIDRWLLEGNLVERWNGAGFHSPGHAAAVANVTAILGRWCRENRDYRAFGYGCPYLLVRSPDTLVTFDASIAERRESRIPIDAEYLQVVPALAVEVVELDEDAELLNRLVMTALRCGVPMVWVVDPFEEIVVVHRRHREPEFVNGGMLLTGGDDLPGFACPVAEIFE